MVRSAQQVFDEHMAALASGQADAIARDYAADAVLMTADGAMVGREAIRAAFAGFLKALPNMRFGEAKTVVEGDTVLVCWSGECDTATLPHGVDTFVIRDGLIQRQTVWFAAVPKGA